MRSILILTLLFSHVVVRAANIVASSASQSDVQTAVTAAVDGDVVLIPNGSSTWTTGITTTKQIIIRAQNITPTPAGTSGNGSAQTVNAGTSTRNVILTNNSTVPLFQMASGNSFNVGLGGIRFNEGTQNTNMVRFTGTGSKVPLLFDCFFENAQRNGNAVDVTLISWLAQGGVIYNCLISGRGFGAAADPGPTAGGACLFIHSPRGWETASTMGTLDTAGTVNLYIEDTTFDVTGAAPDIDVDGRVVMRHCYMNGSTGTTHGYTSFWGGRHWEIYDSTYSVTDAGRNHAGRHFWARAGSGIFTNCIVNNASTANYNSGFVLLLNAGDTIAPTGAVLIDPTVGTTYPIHRQVGGGHNGTSYITDPVYIWNNTGDAAYSWSPTFSDADWSTFIVQDRDVFVNVGAKPGYTKYQYPHPQRIDAPGSGNCTTINATTLRIGP